MRSVPCQKQNIAQVRDCEDSQQDRAKCNLTRKDTEDSHLNNAEGDACCG